MKLIVVGSRSYRWTMDDLARLQSINSTHEISEVVTRGAPGAESLCEKWAQQRGIPVKRFRSATTNQSIAEYADGVVLFPGAQDVESMARVAIELGLKVFDFR